MNMKKNQPIPFESIEQLLNQLLSSGKDQVHDICLFMLNSGLRVSQITEIKFSDVNFTKGTLQINLDKKKPSDTPKVEISLDTNNLKLLTKLHDQYPNDTWVFQSRRSNNQVNKQPRSLSCQAVINTVKQANRHTEHKISLSSFRHAFATNYLKKQLSSGAILDVKNLFKHTDTNMTSMYINKAKN
jgi:integrase